MHKSTLQTETRGSVSVKWIFLPSFSVWVTTQSNNSGAQNWIQISVLLVLSFMTGDECFKDSKPVFPPPFICLCGPFLKSLLNLL